MRGLDPKEETSDEGTPAPTTQAVDASASPIHDAWSKWTSSPANNAALLQFGIAMLQPHAPGQSGIGAAANAVGEGAAASGRVTAAEGEDQKRQAEIEDKESQAAGRTVHGQAELINANAYKKAIENTIANPKGTSGVLKLQGDFNRWLAKPEDTTGLTTDPIVGALAKKYPEVRSKADLLANPSAKAEAFRMFQSNMAEPDPSGAGTPLPAAGETPASTPPQVQSFVNKKTGKSEPFALINGKWVKQ